MNNSLESQHISKIGIVGMEPWPDNFYEHFYEKDVNAQIANELTLVNIYANLFGSKVLDILIDKKHVNPRRITLYVETDRLAKLNTRSCMLFCGTLNETMDRLREQTTTMLCFVPDRILPREILAALGGEIPRRAIVTLTPSRVPVPIVQQQQSSSALTSSSLPSLEPDEIKEVYPLETNPDGSVSIRRQDAFHTFEFDTEPYQLAPIKTFVDLTQKEDTKQHQQTSLGKTATVTDKKPRFEPLKVKYDLASLKKPEFMQQSESPSREEAHEYKNGDFGKMVMDVLAREEEEKAALERAEKKEKKQKTGEKKWKFSEQQPITINATDANVSTTRCGRPVVQPIRFKPQKTDAKKETVDADVVAIDDCEQLSNDGNADDNGNYNDNDANENDEEFQDGRKNKKRVREYDENVIDDVEVDGAYQQPNDDDDESGTSEDDSVVDSEQSDTVYRKQSSPNASQASQKRQQKTKNKQLRLFDCNFLYYDTLVPRFSFAKEFDKNVILPESPDYLWDMFNFSDTRKDIAVQDKREPYHQLFLPVDAACHKGAPNTHEGYMLLIQAVLTGQCTMKKCVAMSARCNLCRRMQIVKVVCKIYLPMDELLEYFEQLEWFPDEGGKCITLHFGSCCGAGALLCGRLAATLFAARHTHYKLLESPDKDREKICKYLRDTLKFPARIAAAQLALVDLVQIGSKGGKKLEDLNIEIGPDMPVLLAN